LAGRVWWLCAERERGLGDTLDEECSHNNEACDRYCDWSGRENIMVVSDVALTLLGNGVPKTLLSLPACGAGRA